MTSWAEEAAVLSLDGGKSCTRKQLRLRELHTKARPSDPSVGGRGSDNGEGSSCARIRVYGLGLSVRGLGGRVCVHRISDII